MSFFITPSDLNKGKSWISRKQRQAQNIKATDILRTTKNVVHNTKVVVGLGRDISNTALPLSATLAAVNPAVGGPILSANVAMSGGLYGVEKTLEIGEKGLDAIAPGVERSHEKRKITNSKEAIDAFVEADIEENVDVPAIKQAKKIIKELSPFTPPEAQEEVKEAEKEVKLNEKEVNKKADQPEKVIEAVKKVRKSKKAGIPKLPEKPTK